MMGTVSLVPMMICWQWAWPLGGSSSFMLTVRISKSLCWITALTGGEMLKDVSDVLEKERLKLIDDDGGCGVLGVDDHGAVLDASFLHDVLHPVRDIDELRGSA